MLKGRLTFGLSSEAEDGIRQAGAIKLYYICAVTAVVVGLYASSLHSYLLFHSLIEIATVAIACSLFILIWNTRRFQSNTFLSIVGIGYALIAIIDLLHLLAYKGMNIFPGYGANLPTQLWIAARFMQAATLSAAALSIGKRVGNFALLLIFSGVSLTLVAMVFSGNFPDCYIDGKGLTVFKIYSEYVITALLIFSMYLLYRKRGNFSETLFSLIISSVACTALSEMSFTVYLSVYGFANMVGHYFKLAAFYLIYRAILVTGLKQPFDLIFRELREKEGALLRSNEILEERVRERTNELLAREAKYRALIECANDAIFIHELGGDGIPGPFIEVNDLACIQLGYNRAELTRMSPMDLDDPRYRGQIATVMKQLIQDGRAVFETAQVAKDGRSIPIEVSSRLIDIEDKKLIFSIVRDITERKRIEEAIRLANAYNRGLIEASIDPLVTIGHDGRITDVNSATEKVTGVPRERLVGRDFSDFFTDPDRARAGYLQAFQEGSVRDYELEIRHVDGHTTPVLYNAIVYRDDKGEVAGVFAAARDISDRINLEEQLRQAQKMEALGTLTGGIAHEFNNILTAIIGYAHFIKSDLAGSPEAIPKIEMLLEASNKAAALVRSMLAFGRKQLTLFTPLELNGLLSAECKMLDKLIRDDIIIKLSPSGLPLVVMADRNQLGQVFVNLVNNAQDAMPAGGIISISTGEVELDGEFIEMHGFGKTGKYALLNFSDNGEGMDETVRQKIFEPFFSTKEVGKGTGLGLSVCYGIIEQHSGYIICESRKGMGTRFCIYLPLVGREADNGRTKDDLRPRGGTETILIAEDNANVREVAKSILEKNGYKVFEAVDGKDALEKYCEHRDEISLAIIDVIMPIMNGRDVYREISRLDPGMKVIFASGYTAEIMEEEEQKAEGFVFVSKPFAPKRLLETVRKILDS